MIIPRLSHSIAFGGDYNPEQWPESVWEEDVKLMREAGVNLVTIGVFSWSRLQSADNRYDFGWLDRVMDLLAANDIGVDLATATASPPPWLSHRYPDVLAVDASGIPYHVGSRQHYSPCSPTYRKFAVKLVRKLAARYAHHPALKAWHINNEYMCHVRECHGADATRAFQKWLRIRYASLRALNATWTTSFWGQHYQAWEEILTPRRTPYHVNPSQQLDYQRFMSDAALELFELERDILRRATPDVPITTNFMGFHKPLDQRRWAGEMDFVSWDSYPDPTCGAGGESFGAAGHDLTRSLKKDRPFVLMEQASAAVNWRPINTSKPPGMMRLWSLQAVARGADGVMFFQWRASRGGAEKYHSAMLPHVDPAPNRVFNEITALGAELQSLAPVAGSLVHARVAIAFDWNAWWAIELEGKPARIDYATCVQEIHRYFYARNIAVDFIHPGEKLDNYTLVLAPALYLLDGKSADNLTRFVAGGGTLLVTYFSAIVDESEKVGPGGYASSLRTALGLWVEEWIVLGEKQTQALRFGKRGQSVPCTHWCDVVHAEGADILATYTEGQLAGRPAVTRHAHGSGTAFYVGTKLDSATLGLLLDQACLSAQIKPAWRTPVGVEATLREGASAKFLFLLNHGKKPARVLLGRSGGCDLLTGRRITSSHISLRTRCVAVIQFQK